MSSNIAVVYATKYDHTKQYVEWLKKDMDIDVYTLTSVNPAKILSYKLVIFMSGVYNDKIQIMDYLKKNSSMLNLSRIMIAAVTWYPNESEIAKQLLIEENYPDNFKNAIPLVILNSGIDKKKITVVEKGQLMAAQIKIDRRQDRTSEDINALAIIKGYSDQTSKDNLECLKTAIDRFLNPPKPKPKPEPKPEPKLEPQPKPVPPASAEKKSAPAPQLSAEENMLDIKTDKNVSLEPESISESTAETNFESVGISSKEIEDKLSTPVEAPVTEEKFEELSTSGLKTLSGDPSPEEKEDLEALNSLESAFKNLGKKAIPNENKPAEAAPSGNGVVVTSLDDALAALSGGNIFANTSPKSARPQPEPVKFEEIKTSAPEPVKTEEAEFVSSKSIKAEETKPEIQEIVTPEPVKAEELTPEIPVKEEKSAIPEPVKEEVSTPAPAPAPEPAPKPRKSNSYLEIFSRRNKPEPAPAAQSDPSVPKFETAPVQPIVVEQPAPVQPVEEEPKVELTPVENVTEENKVDLTPVENIAEETKVELTSAENVVELTPIHSEPKLVKPTPIRSEHKKAAEAVDIGYDSIFDSISAAPSTQSVPAVSLTDDFDFDILGNESSTASKVSSRALTAVADLAKAKAKAKEKAEIEKNAISESETPAIEHTYSAVDNQITPPQTDESRAFSQKQDNVHKNTVQAAEEINKALREVEQYMATPGAAAELETQSAELTPPDTDEEPTSYSAEPPKDALDDEHFVFSNSEDYNLNDEVFITNPQQSYSEESDPDSYKEMASKFDFKKLQAEIEASIEINKKKKEKDRLRNIRELDRDKYFQEQETPKKGIKQPEDPDVFFRRPNKDYYDSDTMPEIRFDRRGHKP